MSRLSRFLTISLSLAGLCAWAAPSETALVAFERGEKSFAAEKWSLAEKSYREALTATPEYPEALNALGNIYFKKGQLADAVAQFRAALSFDSKFKLAYFNLAYVLRKQGDWLASIDAYEKYTLLEPSDPDGHWGLAESLRELKRTSEAVQAYRTYLEKEKRSSEANRVTLAQSFVRDMAKLAEAEAQKASQTERLQAAETQIQVGNYPEAIRLLESVLGVEAKPIAAWFKLGNAYALMGNTNQAIGYWRKVAEQSPDEVQKSLALDAIATAEAKMNARAEASEVASLTNHRAPPLEARDAYESGVRAIYARDYLQAFDSLTKAIELDPQLSVAYVARGSARLGLGRYAEAAEDYKMARRLDSNLSSPLYGLAEAYVKLGRLNDAKMMYQQYLNSSAQDVRSELKAEARAKLERLSNLP